MAEPRTFMVQVNIDDLNSVMVCLETNQEFSDFAKGFQRGVNATRLRDGASDAMTAGYNLGLDARTRAEDFRVKQREGGRTSAANRAAKFGTAQPARSHFEDSSEVTSKTVRTDLRSTFEQSSNQYPNKKKDPVQEGTSTTVLGVPRAGAHPTAEKRLKPAQNLGIYPEEMIEATRAYRDLMRDCRSEEVLNKFPAEKRFLAKGIGSNEDIWKAWQGRTGSLVQGSEVSDRDMLNAILRLINRKGSQAMSGENLAVPMLTTLINSGDFVDALVKVKESPMRPDLLPQRSA